MPRPVTAWQRRHHRFVARFKLHHRRPPAEDVARERAARAPRELDHGIDYLFTSADQAHAMQIWLEANATPYDPWAERLESWAATRRRMKEIAGLINGAAAPARWIGCAAPRLQVDPAPPQHSPRRSSRTLEPWRRAKWPDCFWVNFGSSNGRRVPMRSR